MGLLGNAPASSAKMTMHPQKASKFMTSPTLRATALSSDPAASTLRRNAKIQSLGATCSFEKASVSRQNSIQCSRPMRPGPSESLCACSLCSRSSMAASPVSPLFTTRDANNFGIDGAMDHRGRHSLVLPLARREESNGNRGRGALVEAILSAKEPRMRADCEASAPSRAS